jgi:dihydropteroate synthase
VKKSISVYNNSLSRNAIMQIDTKPFFVMGIVNATPDSFYDGGSYYSVESAFEHAQQLIAEGADILDIGGASSRPGAAVVEPDVECDRVIPVIKKIRELNQDIRLSVDTTWVSVADAAVKAGATIINDISAGRFDNAMSAFVASSDVDIILMHSRKSPQTMQIDPIYDNVVADVKKEIIASISRFTDAGVKHDRIMIDPGIGFAKNTKHNVEILRNIDVFVKTGYPVVLGTSRKRFIGEVTGRDIKDRLCGTLGSIAGAYLSGVKIFRVHDVAATVDFLKVMSAVENGYGVK